MGKVFTLEDIMKAAVQKDMPLGIIEAEFERIEYKLNPENENLIGGANVYFKGYRSIYLPFGKTGEVNFQLDYLLEQLGSESRRPDDVNLKEGVTVKMSRYEKRTEKKLSKDEYIAFCKGYDGKPPAYYEINKNEDGSAEVISTFTNTNFNLKTIKG